ncbi:Crp/Fnr family transcriptional regulator [Methylobacterium sp. V23]|uniref:Crp/Fnr family transcriptional regulator n=1 Tax=Methylobacterium sp. V23 TaxID=2044878 RepID=UPI001FE111A0|nr:Crp/Fnr family transcriptional regulator [Methylobacterium sp. V23]
MLVRKLESIADLSQEERQALQSLPIRVRPLGSGQDIVQDGDRPSQCCLIVEGWAYRYKLLGEGKRQILSFHIPGDTPDLQSLHLQTMDHSLATLTEATLAFIPHENLRELVARFPGLAAVLWRDTLVDAAIFREWMTGIGRKSSYGRVAHLFCEMYLKLEAVGFAKEHRCTLPLTQGQLADALGMSNVHANRVLQEMRSKDLITLKSNELVIHAWSELVHAGEFDPTYLHLGKRTSG